MRNFSLGINMCKQARLLIAFAATMIMWLVVAPAVSAPNTVEEEVERLRDELNAVIIDLSVTSYLDRNGIDAIQTELSRIFRDLDALADRVGPDPYPWDTPHPGDWSEYPNVDILPDPWNARFTGWNAKAKVSLEWGDYGEVIVAVIKNGYKSKCHIYNGYTGNVNASLETHGSGDITVFVQDDLGSHEFRVASGGLGPVFIRGRDDSLAPGKAISPLTPLHHDGAWFEAYYDLVDAGHISPSPSMDWLIGQFIADEYWPLELRMLGEKLDRIGTHPWNEPIGWMEYESPGGIREMAIPDPRADPGEFVHFAQRLHDKFTSAEFFELHIP
jgi:hypothetical protein